MYYAIRNSYRIMKKQPITAEVITSFQTSLFLIKMNLKVNHSTNELMQHVQKAETFLELFLKLDTFPESINLIDVVAFLHEHKHPELERFVCELSSLPYPITSQTMAEITGSNGLLFKTLTMLFNYPEGFDLDFVGSYVLQTSGIKIHVSYQHENRHITVYKDPEAVDLEYYVEEISTKKGQFEFSDLERLEISFQDDGDIVIETVYPHQELFYKNKLAQFLKRPSIQWSIARKQRVINNNYDDFEAYIGFHFTKTPDIN